jgi:hypothetical protein
MKKNNIELRSCQGHRLRFITERAAQDMVDAKAARWRSSTSLQLFLLDRREETTCPAITAGEMRSNAIPLSESATANLTDRAKDTLEWQGEDAEDFIERAHYKVAMWPLIGDTKAVRVSPLCPA